MEQKPPVLYFAEFFRDTGFTLDQTILAVQCLEKGVPMGISMEVGLGKRTMESIDEAIAKAQQQKVDPIQESECKADLHDGN